MGRALVVTQWNGSAKLTAPGGLGEWSGCLCQSLA
jgi:hypothetical protein